MLLPNNPTSSFRLPCEAVLCSKGNHGVEELSNLPSIAALCNRRDWVQPNTRNPGIQALSPVLGLWCLAFCSVWAWESFFVFCRGSAEVSRQLNEISLFTSRTSWPSSALTIPKSHHTFFPLGLCLSKSLVVPLTFQGPQAHSPTPRPSSASIIHPAKCSSAF